MTARAHKVVTAQPSTRAQRSEPALVIVRATAEDDATVRERVVAALADVLSGRVQ